MAKEYTLSIRLTPEMKARLDSYCKPLGLSYTEEYRCHILGLPRDVDGVEELDRLIARLEANSTRLRPRAEAAGTEQAGEGGGEGK